MKSGDYAVKFITDTASYTGDLTIHNGKVQAIIPCNESLSTGTEILNWNQAIRKMTGKTLAPVRVKR